MLLFKANYSYLLKILLSLRQVKRTNKIAKEKIDKIINLHQNFQEIAKMVQEQIKRYYD